MKIHGNVLFNLASIWLKAKSLETGIEPANSTPAQPLNCNLQFDLVIEKGDQDGPET